jgi:glycosyltransferase involved in cell wall biosynthesis
VSGSRIVCFATQGSGHHEETRIAELLADFEPIVLPFDRSDKRAAGRLLLREVRRLRPDLVVMEGTGVAGGLAVIGARLRDDTPYVVSTGDAVGPYVGSRHPGLAPAAYAYERLLFRLSAGCIAWSPYLAGRALTLGAPRAMTAASWADAPSGSPGREQLRSRHGIPEQALVFGIVGTLVWNQRVGYCYGYELVRALVRTNRPDLHVLIIGDGGGRRHIELLAAEELDRRVHLVGSVPRSEVSGYLRAIDVASLPQSRNQVGAFRYTTKLSEYLAAGLPVVTGQIPLAYDLDDGWLWRLPGEAPWDVAYVDALAALMANISPAEVAARRRLVPREAPLFSKERQRRHVAAFVGDILAGPHGRPE